MTSHDDLPVTPTMLRHHGVWATWALPSVEPTPTHVPGVFTVNPDDGIVIAYLYGLDDHVPDDRADELSNLDERGFAWARVWSPLTQQLSTSPTAESDAVHVPLEQISTRLTPAETLHYLATLGIAPDLLDDDAARGSLSEVVSG